MRLIGVTPDWNAQAGKITVHQDYLDAVRRAGALPVLLPLTEDAAQWDAAAGLDGLLFTGGGDVDPALYGEEKQPFCGEISPLRDAMEFGLLRRALAMDTPVLAVCRGLQVLNCVLGGTLYQDIGAQRAGTLRHSRNDIPREAAHAAAVEKTGLLGRITGRDALMVNSRHHQGIKALGRGLRPCAAAPDGITEAAEMPGKRFVLGVQWHPEGMSEKCPEQQAIFNAFVEACKR